MPQEPSIIDPAAAADLLREAGYTVHTRRFGWVECLIEGPDERWNGQGETEASALEDALRRAFPSRLAWELLAARLTTPVDASEHEPAADVPAEPSLEPEPEPAPEPEPEPEPVPEPVPESEAEAEADEEPPEQPPLVETTPPRPPRREPERLPPLTHDEAEAGRSRLWTSIRTDGADVACWAPRRQRLQLLAWIAYARALEDAAPGPRAEAKNETAILARELSSRAASWWPGSVPALQLHAIPRDCAEDVGAEGDDAPASWLEVAGRAEAALSRLEEDADADEHGWHDAAALDPPPPDAVAALTRLRRRLESWTGSLDEKPTSFAPGAGAVDRQLTDTAKTLRWLRGAVDDVETWARCMGRLRFIAQRHGDDELKRLIEPAFRPRRSWASQLGYDPRRRERRKLKREVLRTCPREGEAVSDRQVTDWLRQALECSDLESRRIASLVRPFAAAALAAKPDGTFSSERRHRRRLVKVQELLGEPDEQAGNQAEVLARELESFAEEPDEGEEAQTTSPVDRQLAEVLPHTTGRDVLLVTNRPDGVLDQVLIETFGFEKLDHIETSPRRLDGLAKRVASNRYDLVIAATGFQGHHTDQILKPVADKAGVPYVRANRCRRLACLRALHRDLGLGGSSS